MEKIGDAIGSYNLSSFGMSLKEACTDQVASEKSYDKSVANIYTTERLNEILVSFSEGYSQQATMIEKECCRLVEQYYDELICLIENTHGYAKNEVSLKALKAGKGRISKTIMGAIKEPLSKRMSLDDSECLNILKMDSGVEKKGAMTRFTQKVIKEALNNLSKTVIASLNDQSDDIGEYLNEILEEQEKAIQALKIQYDKMVDNSELEQSDKEKNCVLPLVILDDIDCVNGILQ